MCHVAITVTIYRWHRVILTILPFYHGIVVCDAWYCWCHLLTLACCDLTYICMLSAWLAAALFTWRDLYCGRVALQRGVFTLSATIMLFSCDRDGDLVFSLIIVDVTQPIDAAPLTLRVLLCVRVTRLTANSGRASQRCYCAFAWRIINVYLKNVNVAWWRKPCCLPLSRRINIMLCIIVFCVFWRLA